MTKQTLTTNKIRGLYKAATAWSFDKEAEPYILAMQEKQADEFDAWLNQVRVEVLMQASRDLRAIETGPYESESGMGRDDWGNDSKSIDIWYASWLEEQAAQLGQEMDQ